MNRIQGRMMANAESWEDFRDLVQSIEDSGASGRERDVAIWKAYYTVCEAYTDKLAYILKLGRCIQP